jgi:hypothetical protein
MHYSNLVIIAPPENGDITPKFIEQAVESAMGPHEDSGGFWDWYQIGGRYTGILSGYDPSADPANHFPCMWCDGTGTTTSTVGANYPEYLPRVGQHCIQCNGTGSMKHFPTSWAPHAGDAMPLVQVTPEQYAKFYRIITPCGVWPRERYIPWAPGAQLFQPVEIPPLDWLKHEYPQHIVVVVDNHS